MNPFPDIVMVPVVELIRLEEHDNFGTFGKLRINKSLFCDTLEPSDRENKPFVSSIPAQQYICYRYDSPKFGETFRITNVPGRDLICFHAGNVVEHTEGCIILGQYTGKLKGQRATRNSGKTFEAFMGVMKDVSFFHLTIFEKY